LTQIYRLPDSAREPLKQPFGVLIPDSQVTREAVTSKLVGRNRIIVTVGDRTTERMKDLKVYSNLEIVDNAEKRQSRPQIVFTGSKERQLSAKNPAGSLTDEALEVVRKSLELVKTEPKKAVRIDIDGEEDLIALAILAYFPEHTILLYGQPDQGLVIVGAMGDAKDLAKKTLHEMGIREQPIRK
jgi:GTP-dependent dephospho-CoA kinase